MDLYEVDLPTSDLFDEIFDVHVGTGENARTFNLHKGVISAASKYFEGALKKNTFKEVKENLVVLPNEDPLVFKEFVAWAYTKSVDRKARLDNDTSGVALTFLVSLWVFADAFMVANLGNQVMNTICEWEGDWGLGHCEDAITTAYAKTSENSTLRSFLVDLYVVKRGIVENVDNYPSWTGEILWDVLRACLRHKDLLEDQDFAEIGGCTYYDHTELGGARCGTFCFRVK